MGALGAVPPDMLKALLASVAPPPMKLHDVVVKRKKKYGCVKIEAVPPEEFKVSRHTRHLSESPYCSHTTKKTYTQLIGQGIDADVLEGLTQSTPAPNTEVEARDTVEEHSETGSADINKATREIVVTEHYILLDYEDDGKPGLYRVTTGGDEDTILTKKGEPMIERADFVCFAAMTPIIMTHRLYGRSIADLVMEIQAIKTAVIRGMLDNIYRANNQRLEVASEYAHEKTLDDLLVNRPGNLVRTVKPGGIIPIPNQDLGNFVYPMMEYMDRISERRTGVTDQGQGLDPEALSGSTVGAVAKVFSAAQGKIKLIARIFAETGIRDLVLLMHAISRKHATQQDTFQMRNKWVTVDPRDWKKREDITVKIGTSGASKDAEMAFWANVMTIQGQAMAKGVPIANPKNVYNAAKKVMELGGEKAIELYLTDPDTVKPPEEGKEPPDPKLIEVQGKLQQAKEEGAQKLQLEQQSNAARLQLEQQTTAAKLQAGQQEAAAKLTLQKAESDARLAADSARQQQELAFQAQQAERAHALEMEKAARAYALEQEKAAREHERELQRMATERELRLRQQDTEAALERERISAMVYTKSQEQPVQMGGKVG